MVDDLSDFSKGQAFECFHCYKQVHIVIACCAYCLFLISLYFCCRFVFIVYFCMYVFFLMLPFWWIKTYIYTVFQRNDAKIQITITTEYLTIKYPLTGFNYHLSDVNVANFNKIHRTVSEQQLYYISVCFSARRRSLRETSRRLAANAVTASPYLSDMMLTHCSEPRGG